ncbi:MAG: hypothetical protein AAF862_11990, partial [Pseudomonadota bacterium]
MGTPACGRFVSYQTDDQVPEDDMDYQSLRETYQADGCVKVKNAFSQDWVDTLITVFDAHIDMIVRGTRFPPAQRGTIAPADGDVISATQCKHLRNAVANDDTLWNWAENSPAAQIVGEVIGTEAVQYWYD